MSAKALIPILFLAPAIKAQAQSFGTSDAVHYEGADGSGPRRTASLVYKKSNSVLHISEAQFSHLMTILYDDYSYEAPLRFSGTALVLPLLDVSTELEKQNRLDAKGQPVVSKGNWVGDSLVIGAVTAQTEEWAKNTFGSEKKQNALFLKAPFEANEIPPGSLRDLGNGVVAVSARIIQHRAVVKRSGVGGLDLKSNTGHFKAPKQFVEAWYRARYGVDYDYGTGAGAAAPTQLPAPVRPLVSPVSTPTKATNIPQIQHVTQGPLSKFRVGILLDTLVIKNCTDRTHTVAGAVCQGTEDIVRPDILDTPPDKFGMVSRKVVWQLPEPQPNTLLLVERDCRLACGDRTDLLSFEDGQFVKNAGAAKPKAARKPRTKTHETTSDPA